MSLKRVFQMIPLLALVGLAACAGRLSHATKGFEAFKQNDYKTAETELNLALKSNPNDPYVQLNMAAVYQNTGRPQLARPLYEKVLVTGKDIRPAQTAGNVDASQTLAEIAAANLAKMGPAR